MKNYIHLLLSLTIVLLLSACGNNDKPIEIVYNPYVEAFTHNQVAKNADISVLLSEPIKDELRANDKWTKYIRISPKVKGIYSLSADGKCITFTPDAPFTPGKRYVMTLQLDKLVGAEAPNDQFQFDFTIMEWAARAFFLPITIDPEDDTCYTLHCMVITSQMEDSTEVMNSCSFSEPLHVQWTHSMDGKTHEAIAEKVKATQDARDVVITYKANQQGDQEKSTIRIPSVNEFEVLQAVLANEPSRCVEISFSKRLDPNQDLKGLVNIADSENTSYTIDGNIVRLFPDNKMRGATNVTINAGVQSQSGARLQQSKTFQVNLGGVNPSIFFLGNGNIIPASDQVVVPFQATYLRGVIVRIVRVKEGRMGQFLQENELSSGYGYEMSRVGRLVAHKILWFNEEMDLTLTNTFALDLGKLVQVEPGAMYRVYLSANKDFSLYPGANETLRSKADIEAEYNLKFRQEDSRFDVGGYIYFDDAVGDYKWREREDPTKAAFYHDMEQSRNILASNLGVTALQGSDKQVHVFVHHLITSAPKSGVTITLYNYQGDVLSKGTTDSNGQATLSYTYSLPFYLTAAQGKDRTYVRLDGGSSLSTSSFDVNGTTLQQGTRGFVYGERGVWRPGDTLHLGFILYDKTNAIPANHPVTLELYSPLGQLYTRKAATLGKHGLCCYQIPLDEDAPTGAWEARISTGDVTYHKNIRVETIKPNRLSIQLTPDNKVLTRTSGNRAILHAEWLTGSKASQLKYDIQATFKASTTQFKGYNKYVFQDPARPFATQESELIEGTLDSNGNDTPQLNFRLGAQAPGFLQANLTTKVYEESGEFSTVSQVVSYSPYNTYLGIHSPQEDKEHLNTGNKAHTFQLIALDKDGMPKGNVNCRIRVYKVEWYWWWSSSAHDLADYMESGYNAPIRTITATTDSKGQATFDLTVRDADWGTYYLRAEDLNGGHSTGVLAYFDWENAGNRRFSGAEGATLLPLTLSKEKATPGETVFVNFNAAPGSHALISLENGAKTISIQTVQVTASSMAVPIPITTEMCPNIYIHVMLMQPYASSRNDCPIRLYGIIPLLVEDSSSHLQPVLGAKDEWQPEQDFQVDVSEKAGRSMSYSLAIVDEGLLSLTSFKTPDPWAAFNTREALGVRTWDMYNNVLGAYGGRISQLFSIGGDDAFNAGPKAIVNRFAPVVIFAGPFTLEEHETRHHHFHMPNYSGKVRVMVVATNGQAFGNADKSVPVRRDLQVLGTLPRLLGTGEVSSIPATVFANKDGIGKVQVTLRASKEVTLLGEATQVVELDKMGDKTLNFRIQSQQTTGTAQLQITAKAGNKTATYEATLPIINKESEQIQWKSAVVEAGQSWSMTPEAFGVTATNGLQLELSTIQPISLDRRVNELISYPHGCVEQTTSKLMAQLYLAQLQQLNKEDAAQVEQNILYGLDRLRNFQTAQGGLSYWPGQSTPNGWGSAYALDFIQRAAKAGYHLPEGLKKNLLNYVKNTASRFTAPQDWYRKSEETTQAYRLWVLAYDGHSDMGAMNRLKASNDLNKEAQILLAGAYAAAGRNDVAEQLLNIENKDKVFTAGYDCTYGSQTRLDAFYTLVLTQMGRYGEAASYLQAISQELSSGTWMSTQTTAMSLAAVATYYQAAGRPEPAHYTLTYAGKKSSVNGAETLHRHTLAQHADKLDKVEIKNEGNSILFVQLTQTGVPARGKVQPTQQGISVAISYSATGKNIQVEDLAQGTNFTATVTVRNTTSIPVRNVVVEQLMPSGWEILNTRFQEGGNNADGLSYQDIRDDRIYSYIDLLGSNATVTFNVKLCASYTGNFYLPPVVAQAMYDNTIRSNTDAKEVTVR